MNSSICKKHPSKKNNGMADDLEVYICTVYMCSLDVGNIDDQCRGPSVKEKDHLAG